MEHKQSVDKSQRKKASSFFSHKGCEAFPCHATDDPDNFNCLFCYCPLYTLGRRCGGDFVYTPRGVKDCSTCLMPHIRENYERIVRRLEPGEEG